MVLFCLVYFSDPVKLIFFQWEGLDDSSYGWAMWSILLCRTTPNFSILMDYNLSLYLLIPTRIPHYRAMVLARVLHACTICDIYFYFYSRQRTSQDLNSDLLVQKRQPLTIELHSIDMISIIYYGIQSLSAWMGLVEGAKKAILCLCNSHGQFSIVHTRHNLKTCFYSKKILLRFLEWYLQTL